MLLLCQQKETSIQQKNQFKNAANYNGKKNTWKKRDAVKLNEFVIFTILRLVTNVICYKQIVFSGFLEKKNKI